MTVNFINSFNQSVGDQLVSRLSGYLGEPSEHTKSAINTCVPGILGALVQKVSKQGGASALVEFIGEEQVNGNLLSNMSTLFTGGEATEGLLSQGDKVIDFLFGKSSATEDALVDYLSSRDGINRGASSTLLRLISPMVLGIIGRHINENDLELADISKLILAQKKHIREVVPAGFFTEIGLSDLEKPKSKVTSEEETVASSDQDVVEKTSLLKKIGPWLLLISLALTMLLSMRACGGRPDGIASMNVESEEGGDSTAMSADPKRSVEDSISMLHPMERSKIEQSSFVKDVHAHLYTLEGNEHNRYTFDEVSFRPQTAILTAPSMRQLDHLASLLRAYPDIKIKIEAVASAAEPSTGIGIAAKRADAVKQALIEMGIDSIRMQATGLDIGDPKEAPAQDERVSIGIITH